MAAHIQPTRVFIRGQQRSQLAKTVQKDIRSDWEEIEKLRNTVHELLFTMDERNFRQIVPEIVKLHIIKSYDHLEACVDSIIDTAIYCHDRTMVFARFCHILGSKTIELYCKSELDHSVQKHTFHDVMVRRTQECFVHMRAVYEASVKKAHLTKNGKDVEIRESLYVAKEQLVAISQFVADLYASGVMINSVMHANFATLPFASDQVVLQCLCKMLSSFVEKNKASPMHLTTAEYYFEELRQHFPTVLTACHYRKYDLMRKALHDISAYAILVAVRADIPSLNVKQSFEPPKDKNPLSKSIASTPEKPRAPSTVINFEVVSTKAKATVNGTSPGSTSSLISNAPAVTVVEASSKKTESKKKSDSDVKLSIGGTTKNWAIPLQPLHSPPDTISTFDKLVEVYETRHSNHQQQQALMAKNLTAFWGLLQPDFGHLPWLKRNSSSAVSDQADSLHLNVKSFLDEAERSLQAHMLKYHEIIAAATEQKINELVESLPASSRTEVNQNAHNTALARL